MTRRMVKTVDCTVDVSEEVPQRGDMNSGIACRIRVFVPDGSASGRSASLLPALPILVLCWTVRGKGGVPPGWLESYVGLLHISIASLPRPVTLIERFAGRNSANSAAGGQEDTARRVFFSGSDGRMVATFQSVPCHEVELAIGERLSEGGVRTAVDATEEWENCRTDYEALFPLFGKRGTCYPNGIPPQSGIGSLGEAIHEAAVSLGAKKKRGPILDERMEYAGYHSCRSFCRVRVFDPSNGDSWPNKRPRVVIFTELGENPSISVTNRIEHLATLAWHWLGRPESVPVFIEHYPSRGIYDKARDCWQIPEGFSFVGMSQDADGMFHNPEWHHATRMTVEVIIGQRFDE